MPNLLFRHPEISPNLLIKNTGMDSIGWAYNLNTANYPTYGGEVVQILSVYIDDLYVTGTVKTYSKLEEIYSYFQRYFTLAAQGSDGKGSYSQTPMELTYSERNWTFYIQPLRVPGFTYSRDTVAPQWMLTAHIVDKDAGNYQELHDMIVTQAAVEKLNPGEEFKTRGIINAASADPAQNPFSAPNVAQGNQFKAASKQEIDSWLAQKAQFFNKTVIPAYLQGDYTTLLGNVGAQPIFGHPGAKSEAETEVKKAEAEVEKRGF